MATARLRVAGHCCGMSVFIWPVFISFSTVVSSLVSDACMLIRRHLPPRGHIAKYTSMGLQHNAVRREAVGQYQTCSLS